MTLEARARSGEEVWQRQCRNSGFQAPATSPGASPTHRLLSPSAALVDAPYFVIDKHSNDCSASVHTMGAVFSKEEPPCLSSSLYLSSSLLIHYIYYFTARM